MNLRLVFLVMFCFAIQIFFGALIFEFPILYLGMKYGLCRTMCSTKKAFLYFILSKMKKTNETEKNRTPCRLESKQRKAPILFFLKLQNIECSPVWEYVCANEGYKAKRDRNSMNRNCHYRRANKRWMNEWMKVCVYSVCMYVCMCLWVHTRAGQFSMRSIF